MKFSLSFEIPLTGPGTSLIPTPYCAVPPRSR